MNADLNSHGGTALHKACEEGDVKLARMLAPHCNLDALARVHLPPNSIKALWGPLHLAVHKGTLHVVECLLYSGAAMGARSTPPSATQVELRDPLTTAIEMVRQKVGKGSTVGKLRNAFHGQCRVVTRWQACAWGSAMHSRLGSHSPASLLSPDVAEAIAKYLPVVATVSVADIARRDITKTLGLRCPDESAGYLRRRRGRGWVTAVAMTVQSQTLQREPTVSRSLRGIIPGRPQTPQPGQEQHRMTQAGQEPGKGQRQQTVGSGSYVPPHRRRLRQR